MTSHTNGRKGYELCEDEWRGRGEAVERNVASEFIAILLTWSSVIRKRKSSHREHFCNKSIYNALQMSLHMTTLICKRKQLRSIKNGVRQVMKIDHKYQCPSNMATFRHLFFTKKLFLCVSEIIKQCIANERIDAYLSYSTKTLSSNNNEIRHGCCGAHLIKFGITLTLPTESTILYTTTVEGRTF